MAKVDLASLIVRLEAQTAQFNKQMEGATKTLRKFQASTEGIFKKIATFYSVRELAGFTKAVIDQVDHLKDLGEATGLTVEQLSRLKYAAEQNGGDIDTLSTGLRALANAAADAADGTGAQAQAFKSLGVSVTDAEGNLRPLNEILADTATGFSKYADGANKASTAQTLFSKSGLKMIPLLNQGADGIARLGQESDEAGATISTRTAEAAAKFNDLLDQMKSRLVGVVAQGLTPLLEALTDSNGQIGNSSTVMTGAAGAAQALAFSLKVLATAGLYVGQTLQSAGGAIATLWAVQVQALKGNFSEAVTIWKERAKDYEAEVQGLKDRVTRIWGGGTPLTTPKVEDGRPDLPTPPDENAIKMLKDMSDQLREQVATFGKADAAATRFRLTTGKLAEDVKKAGVEGEKLRDAIIADAEALDRLQATKELKDIGTQIAEQAFAFRKTEAEVLKYRLTMGELAKVVKQAGAGGKELADSLIAQQAALDKLKATKEVADALVDINAEIASLRGNLDGVDLAKFDAAHRDLEDTMRMLNDTNGLDAVQDLRHLTALQSKYNAEAEKAAVIQERLATAEERIRNSQGTGALTEFQAMQALNEERVKAAAALEQIFSRQQAIADEIGNPALIEKTRAFGEQIESIRSQTDLLAKSIKANVTDAFADSFESFVMGTASASDAFKSFTSSVLSSLARMASQNLAETIFGAASTGGGGFFGSIAGMLAGKRAMGGPVSAGQAYLVNENTPNSEIFVPSIAGRIEPAGRGGGMHVENHFVIQAPGGRVSEQTQTQIAAAAARGVSNANRRNN